MAVAMVAMVGVPLVSSAAEKSGAPAATAPSAIKSPYGNRAERQAVMAERQAATEAHREKMEATLANIEALLKELVELEKKRK